MNDADRVLQQAQQLVEHCRRLRTQLQVIARWCEQALYDPVTDIYAVRLPGEMVRDIQWLLDPGTGPNATPRRDAD